MSDKAPGIFTFTAPVVLAFPHLDKPVKFKSGGRETGEEKYSAHFVVPSDHPDLPAMKAICAAVAKAKWPGRDLKELAFPFQSGTKKADDRKAQGKDDGEFQRGCCVIPARSKYEPKLSGLENGKITDYEGEARVRAIKDFYFGVKVLGQLNFVPYSGVGRNPDGVTAYLNMVYTTKQGKKLSSSGPSASEVFKGYAGQATEVDPTVGAPADDLTGLGPDQY